MRFTIGDRVKYDGGDWLFYGTVSAIFEHSISPCYRINVDRMEKKSCRLAITQFEFELEAVVDENEDNGGEKRRWDSAEIELLSKYFGVMSNEDLGKMLSRTPKAIEEKGRRLKQQRVEQSQEQVVVVSPSTFVEPVDVVGVVGVAGVVGGTLATDGTKRGGRRKKDVEAAPIEQVKSKGGKKKILVAEQAEVSVGMEIESVREKVEKEAGVKGVSNTPVRNTPVQNTPVQEKEPKGLRGKPAKTRPKKEQVTVKKRLTWNDYFEKYKNGERSHAIDVWASQNRKEYKTGKMNEDRKDKLIGIRFPLMIVRKNRKRR